MKINQYNTLHLQNKGQKPHGQSIDKAKTFDNIQHDFIN
jgi:hypothetical protein